MLETLVQQLLSEDTHECVEAVQQIGEMARDGHEIKVAVPRLLKFLQHSDRRIRTSALWALGYSGEADAIESIKSTLIQEERHSAQDRDLDVINAARTALMRLEEHQQIDSQKRFVANLEKDLQEEREKPKYQAIVNAEIASVAMGGGEASAKRRQSK
jgi:HEAT repeat protein